jgi:hypothetical protein
MRGRIRKIAGAGLAGVALAASLSPTGAVAGAGVTVLTGAVVVPAVKVTTPQPGDAVLGLVGGPSGIAFARGLVAYALTVVERPTASPAVGAGLAQTVSIVGDQLLGWSYGYPAHLVAISLSTGVRQDLAPTTTDLQVFDNDYRSLPKGTGTGWVDARSLADGTFDALVVHSAVGAADQVFPMPVAQVRLIGSATADGAGVAVRLSSGSNGVVVDGTPAYAATTTYYLSFSTGTWSALPEGVSIVAMSPGYLAWVGSNVIARVPRSDVTASPELRSAPADTAGLAITDTATAWLERPGYPYWNGLPSTLFSAPEPATTPAVAVPQTPDSGSETQVVALGGTDFASGFRQGPAGAGVYRVTAGSASLGEELAGAGGTAVPISESVGQQSSIAPDGRSASVQRVVVRNGSLTLGQPRVILAPAGATISLLATDGPRVAMVSWAGTKATLTVTGVGPKPLTSPVPLTTYALQLSGHRLLVSDEQREDDAAFKGHSRVLELSVGHPHWTTVPDISAISGSTLAYEVNDGSIWLRDLDRPKAHDRQLTPARTGDDRRGDHGQVHISGDWVTWTDWGVFAATTSGAYRLSTRTALVRPNVRSVLADGLAVYIDDNYAVHLVDLSSGADSTLAGASSQGGLSVSDQVLSYVDLENNTVLVPLGSLVRSAARALPVSGDTGVRTIPVTAKRAFAATYAITRPLTSWTFTVRSSKGVVVFRTNGSAPTGWLRVAWNGRGAKGKRLPAGHYSWAVTGSGQGGALTGSSGRGMLHGVVRI